MNRVVAPTVLAIVAASLSLAACSGDDVGPNGASLENGFQTQAIVTDRPPSVTLTPPQEPINNDQIVAPVSIYSSAHFDGGTSLGMVVGGPKGGGKGPIAAKFSVGGNNDLSVRTLPNSNRELLSSYRRSLIESADHIGPVDGHHHAEQETARLAHEHGHDHGQMNRKLRNLLDSADPASTKPDSSAFPAEKE